MNSELEELYQQVILEHSKRPRNFGQIPENAVHVHGDNPSCGDEIFLHVKFAQDGSVEDVKFTGQGCAISQASASLMTLKIKGKPRDDALTMMRTFHGIVTGKDRRPSDEEALGELQLLEGVQHFPQRVKCAMLAWRALEQALTEQQGDVSTEEGE